MISYKDLMIGNWVYESERSKFPMKVVYVGEDYCYLNFESNEGDVFDGYEKDMMPIPLAEDILIKCGFAKRKLLGYENHFTYERYLKGITIKLTALNNCDFSVLLFETAIKIEYVHELQNIVRLITKSDLEIKEI